MEILDSEKRRARNLIWNAAGDYHFEPDFKAYDDEGRADLYWNSIIGAVRKNYGPETIDALFAAFHGCRDEALYEQLVWLGLENAVYQRESPRRLALPALRRRYARWVLSQCAGIGDGELLPRLEEAHFRRALGEDPAMTKEDRKLLDSLEFSGELDGPELSQAALDFLHDHFGFVPGKTQAEEAEALRKHRPWFLFGRSRALDGLPAVRTFGFGYGEHLVAGQGGGPNADPVQRRLTDRNLAQTEEALRNYMRDYFGAPLLSEGERRTLEQSLCIGEHKNCHLYYTQGDDEPGRHLKGYAAAQRRNALRQAEKNREAYEADAVRHRASIVRLTARIRNAMLAYLQPTVVRTASGTLDPGRIWRGVYLDDDKVFTKIQQSDPGQLAVDLLLDASSSQVDRQAVVAAQGYMIAEALTRCHIPVRVTSFCSLSGYTVLTRYRDYQEQDRNERIFRYFTTGCNRDGLAIRALAREIEESSYEHKLVILLSDAKPNDVIQLYRDGAYVDYARDNGIENTAMEVRSLLFRDIPVICVFTGNDDDIPAAHTIYGRNFARIRSLDQFADTVGTLIQNQIRSL
ncbi:MAG: hypothetical protein Q3W96_03290 [Dysosmobacter sp.]|uniref:hypothetical protein n=1 Tax=Dysosmobacter sp. TaxID=2591382 RepID=UPI002849F9ED|nr:hypothetical protein [Dysosmobacter sp.]MDR3982442.1 hypothetical protein [Dysosmobacter sp.]